MNTENLKILIIDDNKADLHLIERYFDELKFHNFKIDYVNTSESGIKLCNRQKHDVIIIDYLLGNENGIEIIKKLKNFGCKSEFILLTGYGNEKVVTEALRVGATNYINKANLSPQLIETTLRHIIHKIEAEQKVRKTESKLSYILERTNIGLAILDKDGLILDANLPYLKMIGVNSVNNIINRSILDWSAKSSRSNLENVLKKCKAEGFINDYETIFDKPDGHQTYVLINAHIEKDNNEQKIYAVCLDITERKHYEQKLKKAKIKAEESDKLKSAFLANMSHEIRTPLNAIVGFTDLLRQAHISIENKENYVAIIKESSDNLLNLINDIIDLSKIEIEKININKIIFPVKEVMKDFYLKYSKFNSSKVKIIYYNSGQDDGINLYSDPSRFKQIMQNLLDNAIKFTESGFIKFGFKLDKADQILFFVEDSGIGISTEKHDIIFERFRKAEESDTKLYRGTGLGLTISKKLVKLLGGSIFLESKKGKGSIFSFTLPYFNKIKDNATEKKFETPRLSSHPWVNKKILIVEDEDLNFLFLEKLLANYKIEVIRAVTGKESIKLSLEHSDLQLVLMDIKLPEMDGLTALKEIKKINPNLTVIAQTAYAMEGDRENFIEKGFDDYIAKPIKVDILLYKLNNYLK